MRTDRAYWVRLRKDARSNWAAGLVAVALLGATCSWIALSFDGSPGTRRLNPLYWTAFLPLGIWGSAMTQFEGWAVRLFRPVAVAAPLAAAAATWLAYRSRSPMTGVEVAFLIASVVGSGVGLILYRGSLVEREGPAR